MVFIYLFYYVISMATIWMCYYFRRFTLADYQYNKSLQRKRRFTIIWTYIVMFLQAGVWAGKEIIFYPIDNIFVIGSGCFFMIAYIFLLGRVEIPKYPFKKK